MRQWGGNVPSTDAQSIQHTGVAPWGRTNHYLFDLNRDWFILANPESRARANLINMWNPQVVVDAHEMGSYDTFLFAPPRDPINNNIHSSIINWLNVFSKDQAKAFNRYGWSYYTKEWFESWFPGYGTATPSLLGAVGILYEQAQTDGSPIKRPDGTVLTFTEAVHHQFVSSIANLKTSADNAKALLQNYYSMKKETVSPPSKGEPQAYYIVPGKNPTRAGKLIERLLMNGIEVEVAEEPVRQRRLSSYRDHDPKPGILPEGTFIIRLTQPTRHLINAILEFDPRLSTEFLQSERESIEKGRGTRLYEASAWSMLLAYNVDAYISTDAPTAQTKNITALPKLRGNVVNLRPAYGYIIDYRDDHAVDALFQLLEKDYKVRIARKPFRIEDSSYPRGALLIRAHENPASLADDIESITQTCHITITGVNTALCQEGPDLGGREFRLLVPPRIALLTGPSVSQYSFGTIWYMLDYELRCRHSVIDYNYFGSHDLNKYNVLIMPSSWGAGTFKTVLGESGLKKLKDWVTDGGTLISTGNTSVFLADSTTAFSKVKLRRQALDELDRYREAAEWEEKAGTTVIDSTAVWEGVETDSDPDKTGIKAPGIKLSKEERAEHDRRMRLFMPRGAIFNTELDEEHWLSYGSGDTVPSIVYTSYAFLSKQPVETAARFSSAPDIRLAGLLWPEARKRWEKTASVTRESYGRGQVIMFAGEPFFRSYFYGTGRILINAMLLGPGLGAQQTVEW
ncbi:hypothetical protein ACFL47_09835 [Candidatus Latescibacterota bacterium]